MISLYNNLDSRPEQVSHLTHRHQISSNFSAAKRTKEHNQYSRCQEFGVLLPRDLAGEVLRGEVELVALGRVAGQLVGLLAQQAQRQCLVNALALGRRDAMAYPLPELRA